MEHLVPAPFPRPDQREHALAVPPAPPARVTHPPMRRREPTGAETAALREAVRDLAWNRARTLAGLSPADPPESPFDAEHLDPAGHQAAVLAHLAALHDLAVEIAAQIDDTVAVAGATQAPGSAIGAALGGITRSAVRQRWPDALTGPTGRRRPEVTDLGREHWFGGAEDGIAERDWLVRARVRLRREVRTGGFGTYRSGAAGEVLVMVMRGRAGDFVATDCWSTDEPAAEALLAYADSVQVLEVLEEVSPWADRPLTLRSDDPDHRSNR